MVEDPTDSEDDTDAILGGGDAVVVPVMLVLVATVADVRRSWDAIEFFIETGAPRIFKIQIQADFLILLMEHK